MKDFLHFNRFITGDIIKYVFWVLAGIAFLVSLFGALVSLIAGEFGGFLLGLVFAVIGPVLIRIYCEMMIVLFKIHETLVDIRNK